MRPPPLLAGVRVVRGVCLAVRVVGGRHRGLRLGVDPKLLVDEVERLVGRSTGLLRDAPDPAGVRTRLGDSADGDRRHHDERDGEDIAHGDLAGLVVASIRRFLVFTDVRGVAVDVRAVLQGRGQRHRQRHEDEDTDDEHAVGVADSVHVQREDEDPHEAHCERDGGADAGEPQVLLRELPELFRGALTEDPFHRALDVREEAHAFLGEAHADEVPRVDEDPGHGEVHPALRILRQHRREEEPHAGDDREDAHGGDERRCLGDERPTGPPEEADGDDDEGDTLETVESQGGETVEAFGAVRRHQREHKATEQGERHDTDADLCAGDGAMHGALHRGELSTGDAHAGEEVQAVEDVLDLRRQPVLRVPVVVAHEGELDRRPVGPNDHGRRACPCGFHGRTLRDATPELQIHLVRSCHGLVAGGQLFPKRARALVHAVEPRDEREARVAFHFANDVDAGLSFLAEDLGDADDDLLFVRVEGVRDDVFDSSRGRRRRRGDGGCGRSRGGARGGSSGSHECSDGGVVGEVVPVLDQVRTGAFFGFSGHAAQEARRCRNGFDEFAEQGQQTAPAFQALSDEQEERTREVREPRVEVEEDSDDPPDVVSVADPVDDLIRKALFGVFQEGVDHVFGERVGH